MELTNYSSAEVENIPIESVLAHCYTHLDIGYKLSELIKAIGFDNSDADTHIKIHDYRCDLSKGFFMSSPYIGINALVEDIIEKA